MDNLGDELERLKKAGDYPTLTTALLKSFSDDDLEHEIFSFISKKKVKGDYGHAFELVSKLSPGLLAGGTP